jgi:sec-independent protein translocase protein TatA
MGNIGMKELVVILLVVLLVFGAKKLKNIGSDLGAAVKGFKKSMSDGEEEQSNPPRQLRADGTDAEFPESGSKAAPAPQSTQTTNDRRSA